MPHPPIATIVSFGTTLGGCIWVVSLILLILSFPVLLIAMILRVSSRRFTPLVYGPAFSYAFLSIVLDLLGSLIGFASEQKVIFGWAWHAGQSGIALVVGAIAFILLRREPNVPGKRPFTDSQFRSQRKR